MTEPQAIDDSVRTAANIVKELATTGTSTADMTPLQEVGSLLANFVGKSVDEFLKTEEKVRDFLRDAAVLVSKRYNNVNLLFGFLKHLVGHLQKGIKMPKDQRGRTCVFLTALVDRDEAERLRAQLIVA